MIGSTQFPISPRLCSIKDNIIVKNNNDPVYQINSNMVNFDFHNNMYKATNMGNIPAFYNQQNNLFENFSVDDSDYGAFEQTVYGGDIIFDNKYGDQYYKYLNKTLFDEINYISDKMNYTEINDYISDIPFLPSTAISSNYNINPFMLLFLCVISLKI